MTIAAHHQNRRRRAQRGSGEQLRSEIVAATKDLLAHAGTSGDVSIRAVAERVGVTSPSIYLHFADKDQLIQAAVADVWAGLDEAMLTALAASAPGPLERLKACGKAYVQFALDHPEHYRVATMAPWDEPCEVDDVVASSAFVHFAQAIADCMQAGVFAPGDPVPVALQLWAAAHGIASLLIAKPFLPWGDVEALTERILCASAMGRAVSDLLDEPTPTDFTGWLAQQRP